MNLVLDASVAIKVFIDEEGAEAARALVASGARFIAPSLVVAETANVLVKRLRRREVAPTYAAGVLVRLVSLFDELTPIEALHERAFAIAADHQLSAYDALYVALAEARKWPLATADQRLADRLARSRLGIDIWTP
ncbi:MAG TPA: type II toxin-antitoxin system VapC family toxin [Caulobacteraceae bacterium]|jgi:predicted nucleic acid-binding protein|nr:type II toxin-antitoxin system VapC family toxin [Caulobacteraceae bacterium]